MREREAIAKINKLLKEAERCLLDKEPMSPMDKLKQKRAEQAEKDLDIWYEKEERIKQAELRREGLATVCYLEESFDALLTDPPITIISGSNTLVRIAKILPRCFPNSCHAAIAFLSPCWAKMKIFLASASFPVF